MARSPRNNGAERRAHLGRIISDLRVSHGVSGRELSRRAGIPQSHISKFENGKLSASQKHLKKISDALRLTTEESTRLQAWNTLLDHDFAPFLLQSEEQVAENQRIILNLERNARVLRGFQINLVPGLLQTPDYMRAIFDTVATHGGVRVGERAREKAVKVRLDRQQILKGAGKRFLFLLHESALNARYGSRAVMRAQLEWLIELNRTGLVSLALIPSNRYWTGELPITSFDIFDRELVLLDVHAGLLYLWMNRLVDRYTTMFDDMWLKAVVGMPLEKELERIHQAL